MKIILEEINETGYLLDKYCDGALDNQRIENIPYINFPFSVQMDKQKKYLTWTLIDHDSNPVVSFSWLHWLVANYELEADNKVIEDLINSKKKYVGGVNSFASPLANITNPTIIHNYGGPTPPDKSHIYTLEVYAHDEKLDLQNGFYLNELYSQLENIEYEKASIKIKAKCYN